MSKLLFIYERDMPTVSITRDMFTHLKGFWMITSDFMYLDDVIPADIDEHDVIIFMRPANGYSWKIAEEARKSGHTTVTFCDDDLLNLPGSEPNMPWRKKGLLRTLANSDVIWSSSKYILSRYQKLTAGKRIAITDTIIQSDEVEEIDVEHNNETIKIVYAAAPSHSELFEKYISPIVPKLAAEFGDRISFTFISVHPKIEGVRCEYLSGMPLSEYRDCMKRQRFDIGVAPLYSNEFSKCKYFNKFLEYTMQGVAGIYSKTEPYTYVVKDGENGLLAEDDPESWYQALSTAIRDKQLREKCVENAVKYIKENHSERACIEKIIQGIPEILESKNEYIKCQGFVIQKYKYYLSRPLDWIYLMRFYLKNTGIRAVIKRTRIHFTEAKAYRKKKQRKKRGGDFCGYRKSR